MNEQEKKDYMNHLRKMLRDLGRVPFATAGPLDTPAQKVAYLKSTLIGGGPTDSVKSSEYSKLQQELVKDPEIKKRLPNFVRRNPDRRKAWEYIARHVKSKESFHEWESFVDEAFYKLEDYLDGEGDGDTPHR